MIRREKGETGEREREGERDRWVDKDRGKRRKWRDTSKSLLILTVLTSLSKWTVMEAPSGTSTSPFLGAFSII